MKRTTKYQPPRRPNKVVDKQMTVNVENYKLNQLLADYQADSKVERLNPLLTHMMHCRVLVPAKLNDQKQPMPCIIKNKDGTMFFPLYTDKGQIPAHMKSEAIVNMPFLAVNRTALKGQELAGIVVNPFSNNLVFKHVLLEKIAEAEEKKSDVVIDEPVQKTVKMTEQQYVQFERHKFEAAFLPKKLFEEGQEFLNQVSDEKEEYIDVLFEESFQEKRMYPYLAEEFSVMTMHISEDFSVVRIDMPERDMLPGLARRVYCTYYAKTGRAGYYLICAGKKGEEDMLNEISEQLKPVTHGEAPAEGAELATVIDLAQVSPEGLTS